MAKNTQLSNIVVNAQADALARLLDNGYARLYSGTQPDDADTALSSNTLLAELRVNATSAPAAEDGVLTFNAITADSSANNNGTASFIRFFKSDGTTVVMDVSAGLSNANFIMNTLDITIGMEITITALTHTVAKSSSGY